MNKKRRWIATTNIWPIEKSVLVVSDPRKPDNAVMITIGAKSVVSSATRVLELHTLFRQAK